MSDSISRRVGSSQSANADLVETVRSANADLRTNTKSASADLEEWLDLVNRAMRDTGWTPEALDTLWNTSRGYAGRLFAGDKTWSVERMLSLPDDLEARL